MSTTTPTITVSVRHVLGAGQLLMLCTAVIEALLDLLAHEQRADFTAPVWRQEALSRLRPLRLLARPEHGLLRDPATETEIEASTATLRMMGHIVTLLESAVREGSATKYAIVRPALTKCVSDLGRSSQRLTEAFQATAVELPEISFDELDGRAAVC